MRTSIRGYRPSQTLIVLLSLGLLWWALTGDLGGSWWLGAPLVLLGTALVFRTAVPRLSLTGAVPFLLFFLRRALAGAVDVARRALDPRLPLDPGFLTCRLRLPDDAALVLATAVLNLHPGTLVAELHGTRITLHVVDRTRDIETRVRATEDAVARLLGLPLMPADA